MTSLMGVDLVVPVPVLVVLDLVLVVLEGEDVALKGLMAWLAQQGCGSGGSCGAGGPPSAMAAYICSLT